MRGKSLALLILALGCGLVASLGITQVLAKRGETAAPVDTAPVFVAKADISPGAVAGGELVKLEQWPKDKIPAGAISKQEDLDNRRARQSIFNGQPILDRMLLHPGEVPLDAQIPKGMRVVAIPVGPETIQSGLVVPGARCDIQVFVRQDANQGFAETLAKTILQDIRVFAVNDITNLQQQQQPGADPKAPDNTPHSIPTGKTVSLLVTPAQAEVVTLASQLGTVRLILRSGDDTEQTKLDSFGASKLFSGLGRTNREIENQKKKSDEQFDSLLKVIKTALAAPAAKPHAGSSNSGRSTSNPVEEAAHYTMRFRNGDTVSDVVLTANIGANGLVSDDSPWTASNLPTPSKSSTADMHVPISTNVAPAAATSGGTAAKQSNDPSSPAPKTNVKPPMGT
jgi:pilus assembly protein CpaB